MKPEYDEGHETAPRGMVQTRNLVSKPSIEASVICLFQYDSGGKRYLMSKGDER